jgi:DNA-binding GntR family transcriptional regulator
VITRHEPGYPLPRRTALARRFQATPAEIDAAVDELVRRQLLRRLPTGEVHRAGPAEYVVSLDEMPGLSSFIDPMDHRVSCTAVRVSRLRAATEIADVLGLAPGAQVHVRRCLWTADGAPAATRVVYVPERHAYLLADLAAVPPAGSQGGSEPLAAALGRPGLALRLGAVRIEIQPPARSVARRLRLANGSPAFIVTARFDDAGAGQTSVPAVLTVLALRPDLFRIVIDTQQPGDPVARQMAVDSGAAARG